LLGGNEAAGLPACDPERWAKDNSVSPAEAINSYSTLLLENDVNPATQKLATRLASADPKPNFPAALQVLLQAPEYQLA
jgi:hypothetical protein